MWESKIEFYQNASQATYPGMESFHAERGALNEFWLDTAHSGTTGRMFTNREVCRFCLEGNFRGGGNEGAVIDGVRATGLDTLYMRMDIYPDDFQIGSRFRNHYNPFLVYDQAGVVVTQNRWRAIRLNPSRWD